MKRIRFLLFMLFAAASLDGVAQIYYERWIDNNRSSAYRGNLILGEQNLTVDLSDFPWSGLHFLNILPFDESGEPGVWQCIPFVMPETWPGTSQPTLMEYWVSGYDTQPKLVDYVGSAVTLDIDISSYSPGLHFLNVRTLNEDGEAGPWKQIAFMVPEAWPGTSQATMLEYWVSSYDSKPKLIPYSGSAIALDIDISQMSYGLHYLNVRMLNEAGEAGAWKQIPFYIDNFLFDEEEMAYEYWIDDNEHQSGIGYFPGQVVLKTSTEKLGNGSHTFNFKGSNKYGMVSDVYSFDFDLSQFLYGDVNHDGKVDISDVVAVINTIAGLKKYDDADVNTDGDVNISDVVSVINAMVQSE